VFSRSIPDRTHAFGDRLILQRDVVDAGIDAVGALRLAVDQPVVARVGDRTVPPQPLGRDRLPVGRGARAAQRPARLQRRAGAGVTVVAHDGNKKELDAALAAGGRGAPPADRLPSQVVTKNKDTVTIDGVKLELLHWAPAHTSGDLVVYLPDQKIVFAGDITTGAAYIIQTNRPSPLIHANKMGSSEGWITTVKGMLALNADQYVPGHGDVQTKADIQTVLKATEEKRAKIAAMVKDGKSLDEIRVVTGDVPRPAAGAGRGPAFASFTDVVYQELTKKRG